LKKGQLGEENKMIILHKLNGDEFVLNANHIELVEEKPDTTITLINERIYIVKEKKEEVVRLAVEYYDKIQSAERFQK
jgi:flagellar protein FlbD